MKLASFTPQDIYSRRLATMKMRITALWNRVDIETRTGQLDKQFSRSMPFHINAMLVASRLNGQRLVLGVRCAALERNTTRSWQPHRSLHEIANHLSCEAFAKNTTSEAYSTSSPAVGRAKGNKPDKTAPRQRVFCLDITLFLVPVQHARHTHQGPNKEHTAGTTWVWTGRRHP